jgi:hypothetical protein
VGVRTGARYKAKGKRQKAIKPPKERERMGGGKGKRRGLSGLLKIIKNLGEGDEIVDSEERRRASACKTSPKIPANTKPARQGILRRKSRRLRLLIWW